MRPQKPSVVKTNVAQIGDAITAGNYAALPTLLRAVPALDYQYSELLHPTNTLFLMEYAPEQWARLQGTEHWHTSMKLLSGIYKFRNPDHFGEKHSSKTLAFRNPQELAALFVKHQHQIPVQISLLHDHWNEEMVAAMLQPKQWNQLQELGPIAATWLRRQINDFPRLGRVYAIAHNWPLALQTGHHILISNHHEIKHGEPIALACILFGIAACKQHRNNFDFPPIAEKLNLLPKWNPKTEPPPLTPEEITKLHCWIPKAFTKTWGISSSKEPQLHWPETGQLSNVNTHNIQVTPTTIVDGNRLLVQRLNQHTVLIASQHNAEHIIRLLRKRGFTFIDLKAYAPFNQYNNKTTKGDNLTQFCLDNLNWQYVNQLPFPQLNQWLSAESNPETKQRAKPALLRRLQLEELVILQEIANASAESEYAKTLKQQLHNLAQVVTAHCPELELDNQTICHLL